MSFTNVIDDTWQCNDCGAHAEGNSGLIEHFETCCPGDSEKWEKHYALYGAMMNQEGDIPCGCPTENLWYDDELGIYRCRNCGWCS